VGARGQKLRGETRLSACREGSTYVRFGSLADIEARQSDVRFTPESRHWRTTLGCRLCAISDIRKSNVPRGPVTRMTVREFAVACRAARRMEEPEIKS
jgi:hypothetical protein